MFSSLRSAALFLLLTTATASSLLAAWHHFPAGNPVVNSLAADSAGAFRLVSLDDAGLWLTENGGTTWQPISARLSADGRLLADQMLVVDATAETLLCRTRPSGNPYHRLYRSSFDGGLTWNEVTGLGQEEGAFAVHSQQHGRWFWASQEGFYRSCDCGQTWETFTAFGVRQPGRLFIDPAHDSTLYCASYYYWDNISDLPGLLRSRDFGATWESAINLHGDYDCTSGCVRDVTRLSNGDLFAVVQFFVPNMPTGNLLHSTNDGQSWDRIFSSPGAHSASRLIEDPAHPGRLFMSSACPGGLMRSDNYGRTWYPAGGSLPADEQIATEFTRNPYSSDLYVTYSERGVFRSTDGGESWQPLNHPPMGYPRGEFMVTPEATFLWDPIYDAWQRQWEVESPFAQWRELAIPRQIEDSTVTFGPVLEKHGDTLIACANVLPDSFQLMQTRMIRSTDDGLTWHYTSTVPHGLEIDLANVLRTDSFTRIIVPVGYYWDTLALTEDFGVTWSEIPRDEFAGWWLTEIAQSEQAIYAITSDWDQGLCELWRTTNRGVTWDSLRAPRGGYSSMILFGDELVVANIWTRAVHYWRNGEWDERGPLPFSLSVGWELIGLPGENPLVVGLVPLMDSLWMTTDIGMTWTSRACEYPYPTQNMSAGPPAYDPYRQRIWIATGTGACYLELSDLASAEPLRFKPADYTLLSVYPNPFNSVTRIRFDLDHATRVTLNIYDLTGRLVKTMIDEGQNAGRHEILFDGRTLTSGTYFARLTTDRLECTQKVLLLR